MLKYGANGQPLFMLFYSRDCFRLLCHYRYFHIYEYLFTPFHTSVVNNRRRWYLIIVFDKHYNRKVNVLICIIISKKQLLIMMVTMSVWWVQFVLQICNSVVHFESWFYDLIKNMQNKYKELGLIDSKWTFNRIVVDFEFRINKFTLMNNSTHIR